MPTTPHKNSIRLPGDTAGLKPFFRQGEIEAGIDEAGRGSLAGPVFAAAVIWPPDMQHPALNDSKKLSEKYRYKLRDYILEHALSWSVSHVTNQEIDRLNILNATFSAMHKAIDALPITPTLLLIDGNRFHQHPTIPHECIVKGDSKYLSIAAASILAKTYRDDKMKELHHSYPGYYWDTNKGYGTRGHREALIKLGVSPFHRRSFRLINHQLKIHFPGQKHIEEHPDMK